MQMGPGGSATQGWLFGKPQGLCLWGMGCWRLVAARMMGGLGEQIPQQMGSLVDRQMFDEVRIVGSSLALFRGLVPTFLVLCVSLQFPLQGFRGPRVLQVGERHTLLCP